MRGVIPTHNMARSDDRDTWGICGDDDDGLSLVDVWVLRVAAYATKPCVVGEGEEEKKRRKRRVSDGVDGMTEASDIEWEQQREENKKKKRDTTPRTSCP